MNVEKNMARDLKRLAFRDLGIRDGIELYYVDTLIAKSGGNKIQAIRLPVLLPHEIFGLLHSHFPLKFARVFGSMARHRSLLQNAQEINDGWWRDHPMKSLIDAGIVGIDEIVCLRIFGDDVHSSTVGAWCKIPRGPPRVPWVSSKG